MLEALACGVPVAAYPLRGTRDVIRDDRVGVLDNDLRHAALTALSLDPQECRSYAREFSWDACTRQFVENLVPMAMRTD
jgi:glycosyltransferase involved in cell wall biosynthesis